MKRLLIGLVLSVMATAASAQWVLVHSGSNGDKFYADPTTKRRTGSVVRIWELQDYTKPEVFNGKVYYSYRSYGQYDCAEMTHQSLQGNSFAGKMGSGEVVSSSSKPTNKSFIAPGTVAESLIDLACK